MEGNNGTERVPDEKDLFPVGFPRRILERCDEIV